MLKLGYHDDGKCKPQSHEIIMMEDPFYYNYDFDVWSLNPLEVRGYGETKEEAVCDFKRKFQHVMTELKIFEAMLLDTDVITDNIVSVDCFGKEIVK